jgi:hypothetical protein
VSVVTLPRKGSVRPRPSAPGVRRAPARAAVAPRRRAVVAGLRRGSPVTRAAVIVLLALSVSIMGSMFEANRQIEIHTLQTDLLQAQSTYAAQVGSLTYQSGPGQVLADAGALRLVDPLSVTQVSSTSLDAPLPLPKFSTYAPVTSRTSR